MMTFKLQVTILLMLVLALIAIVNMIRRKSLELKYALSWLFVLAVVAIFAAFPRSMVYIARFLGIDAPVNMIFFLGFVFSLIIIYNLTVTISRMSIAMRKLTQIIAFNEDRIKELEERVDKAGIPELSIERRLILNDMPQAQKQAESCEPDKQADSDQSGENKEQK